MLPPRPSGRCRRSTASHPPREGTDAWKAALVGPAGLADQHPLAGCGGPRARHHGLHVGQRLLARAAFPERVAVGHHHVAGGGDARMLLEQVVGVHIAHRHAGQRVLHPLDAGQQRVFRHVLAQQHLVAHGHDVGMAGAGHLDHALQLTFIDVRIGAQPGTHQGLQAQFVSDARRLLVAIGAGEAADPARMRLHDRRRVADLRRRRSGHPAAGLPGKG
jgi:hypothetical protein